MKKLEILNTLPQELSQELSQDECIEHKGSHQKNRNEVINILQGIPEIVGCAKELKRDTVYKIVLAPKDGSKLTPMKKNVYQAVFRSKDGKIAQHARLKALNPNTVTDILRCAKGIGSQVLLIKIAMDINDIQKKIDEIKQGATGDRIEQINSGIQMYEQAVTMRDKNNQQIQILHTCQTLNEGIAKSIRDLKAKIEDMPDPELKFSDNWIGSKAEEAKEKYEAVQEVFRYCLRGIFVLTKCYASIGEVETARKTLGNFICKIQSCGIDEAAEKSRLVPRKADKEGELPESLFQNFLDYSGNDSAFMRQMQICESFTSGEFDCIEIEIKPSEIISF